MKLGKVIGQVVSTKKEGNVQGLPILIVSYLDEKLDDTGKTAACIDTVNAGNGDVVLLCASSSARMTATTSNVATDNTIVGIVDSVSVGSRTVYKKGKA
ncbi:MAG TPA: EutN/CcmL family microcompartment protein [Bacteroidota bacterium]|nr:EutN/CcmL family microcompartment protein [Bacteroidota bacterium]